MAAIRNPQELIGAEVFGKDGEKIGKIGNVYVSDQTNQPQWVTVHTGLFGLRESFLPLNGARMDGQSLHVNTTKDVVKDAPQMNANGHLSESEGQELYQYYGMTPAAFGNPSQPQQNSMRQQQSNPAQQRERERSRPSTMTADVPETPGQRRPHDDAMIRSEEQLKVGTEQVESGRVRLRKYVVTEEQQVTVPLRHEEVRVVREPIKPGDRSARSAQIGEDAQEVVLHGERPVVGTEAVPVERVRLDKQTVTEQKSVKGEVRKERIDVDGDAEERNL